jgi:hypothetical protein
VFPLNKMFLVAQRFVNLTNSAQFWRISAKIEADFYNHNLGEIEWQIFAWRSKFGEIDLYEL